MALKITGFVAPASNKHPGTVFQALISKALPDSKSVVQHCSVVNALPIILLMQIKCICNIKRTWT